MAECPHGEVDVSCCFECIVASPPERPGPSWARVGTPFTAVHPSFCQGCEGQVEPGQQIQRWDFGDDQATAYTHARCQP